jgi:hypothetical protein
LVRQELDPLHHGLIGSLQSRDPLPVTVLAHQGTRRQHQPVVDIGLHDHPVFPPPVPLVRGKGHDVCGQTLVPELEVVGPEMG